MSKQSIKIIISSVSLIIMLGFLKNMFTSNNNEALKSLIENNAFLVDVRTPQEFLEGHAPGTVNIPLDQVPNQLSKFKNHKNIVVFCRSGNRSGQALQILNANGFNNVVNGGTWQQIKAIKDATGK